MKKIFTLLFLLFFIIGFTQNSCDCPGFTKGGESTLKNLREGKKEYNRATLDSVLSKKESACQIMGLLLLAKLHLDEFNLDSMPPLLDKAKLLMDRSKCGVDNYVLYDMFYGSYYYRKGKYDKSLNYALDYLTIVEKQKDTVTHIDCLLNVSLLLSRMKQPEKGIEYFKRALVLNTGIKDKSIKAKNYLGIGSRYRWFYQEFGKEEYYSEAEALIFKGMKLAKELNDKSLIKKGYTYLSDLAYEKGKYSLCATYIDSAKALAYHEKDYHLLYSLNSDMADVCAQLKNHKLATVYADSGVYYAKLNDDQAALLNAWQVVYETAKSFGNTTKALEGLEQVKLIGDSLMTKERTEIVSELEQKYNKIQNEKRIALLTAEAQELEQQKEIDSLRIRSLVWVSVVILLLLVIVVFLYRQNVTKNKLKVMEVEQRLNRARMNPHFFFNVLYSLQGLTTDAENLSTVRSLISKLSRIMRQSLESTYEELVSIEEENDFLVNYLELQKIRYPKMFDYTISIDDEIDSSQTMVPGMIIQPFIENSIEHGFKNVNSGGLISIAFSKQSESLLKISITDNGSGFEINKENKEFPSRATQIIKDRLFLLNIAHKSDARYELSSGEKGGISVTILLPLIV